MADTRFASEYSCTLTLSDAFQNDKSGGVKSRQIVKVLHREDNNVEKWSFSFWQRMGKCKTSSDKQTTFMLMKSGIFLQYIFLTLSLYFSTHNCWQIRIQTKSAKWDFFLPHLDFIHIHYTCILTKRERGRLWRLGESCPNLQMVLTWAILYSASHNLVRGRREQYTNSRFGPRQGRTIHTNSRFGPRQERTIHTNSRFGPRQESTIHTNSRFGPRQERTIH